MRIDIYSKDNCPFCTKAFILAQKIQKESSQQNHTMSIYKLDRDFTREELMEKFPGAKTFPQIMIDKKVIGGYQEFEAWYND